jgi:hypothetical protein
MLSTSGLWRARLPRTAALALSWALLVILTLRLNDGIAYAGVAAVYALLAGAVFWHRRRGLPPLRLASLDLALAAWAVALLARAATTPQLWHALALAPAYLLYPMAYFASRALGAPPVRGALFGFALPLFAGLAAWSFYDQFVLMGRVDGPMSDSNGFAALTAALMVVSIGLALGVSRLRWLAAPILLAGLPALYFTESRGAAVALGLVSGGYLLVRALATTRGWPLRRRGLVFGALAMVVLLAAGAAAPYVKAKFEHPDIALQSRLALLRTAVQIGLEHSAWTGGGIGTFSREYSARRPLDDQDSAGLRAHNDYVELFTDGGLLTSLPLLLVSVTLGVSTLVVWWRAEAAAGAMLAGATYLALHAGMNHLYMSLPLALTAGVLAGWGQTLRDGRTRRAHAADALVRGATWTSAALLVPVLLFFACGEAHVRAQVAFGPSAVLYAPFRTERGLRFFAESGWMPRAAFAYAMRAEAQLVQQPPGTPGRAALARDTLRRYRLAYEQGPDTGYAYKLARLLELTPELATDPALAPGIETWYETALRRDPLNFAALHAYSQWLARHGKSERAVVLLDTALRHIWRPALREPLLKERARAQAQLAESPIDAAPAFDTAAAATSLRQP